MICKCGGNILARPEESILYCNKCGVVMDMEGNVLNGVYLGVNVDVDEEMEARQAEEDVNQQLSSTGLVEA